MKNDPDLVKNQIIAFSVKQSVTVANAMSGNSQAISALCEIAQLVLKLDKEKGLLTLNCAIKRAKSGRQLANIIKVMAPYDLNNALKIAHKIKNNDDKTIAISKIVQALAKVDFRKANDLQDSFCSKAAECLPVCNEILIANLSLYKHSLAIIAKNCITMAKYDIKLALRFIDQHDFFDFFDKHYIENLHFLHFKFKCYKKVAEIIISLNQIKGLEIANQAVAVANLFKNSDLKIKCIKKIVRSVFLKHDRNRAIELANSIGDHEFVAKALAKSNLDEALHEANGIEIESSRCVALCKIAKEICTQNPEKAIEIIEQAVVYAKSPSNIDIFETTLTYCAGTLAIFNLEKALELSIALKRKSSRAEAFTKILKKIAPKNPKATSKVAYLFFKEAMSIVYKEKGIGKDEDNTHNLQSAQRLNTFLNVAKTLAPF